MLYRPRGAGLFATVHVKYSLSSCADKLLTLLDSMEVIAEPKTMICPDCKELTSVFDSQSGKRCTNCFNLLDVSDSEAQDEA